MTGYERNRAVRALLLWSIELRLVALKIAPFRHAHHAMVFAVPAAARRQVCLTLWCQSKERGSKRKAQDGQQRDGDKLAQYGYWNIGNAMSATIEARTCRQL